LLLAVAIAIAAALAAGAATARPPSAASGAKALPPPRFGHTLDIGLVSGTVIVTPPGRASFKLGVQDRNIPIGSLLDTTHGRIDLRAAPLPGTAQTARVQDAEFYKGKFRVRQPAGDQFTQVLLAGGDFSACGAVHSSAALPHRVIRLLGASGKGKFATRGRYAAATVRGTIWTTTDYCDGTLVSVQKDVVSVRDLVHHKTVTVTAGHSYFVRAL
jgi:hypothetical protein